MKNGAHLKKHTPLFHMPDIENILFVQKAHSCLSIILRVAIATWNVMVFDRFLAAGKFHFILFAHLGNAAASRQMEAFGFLVSDIERIR